MANSPESPHEHDNPESADIFERIRTLQETKPEVFRAVTDMLWYNIDPEEREALESRSTAIFGQTDEAGQDEFIRQQLLLNYLNLPPGSTR